MSSFTHSIENKMHNETMRTTESKTKMVAEADRPTLEVQESRHEVECIYQEDDPISYESRDKESSRSSYEVDYDINPTKLYSSICDNNWGLATERASRFSQEARTWVVRKNESKVLWRFLPLHSACARSPPAELIHTLLKAHPEAVRCTDDRGMLPLHYACGNSASEEVLIMLLSAYPQSTRVADPQNRKLPIHHLCQWGNVTEGIVNMFLFAYPESMNVVDGKGRTPLELATSNGGTGDIIKQCMKQFYFACGMKEDQMEELKQEKENYIKTMEKVQKESTERVNVLVKELQRAKVESGALTVEARESATKEASYAKEIQRLEKALESILDQNATLVNTVEDLENKKASFEIKIQEMHASIEVLRDNVDKMVNLATEQEEHIKTTAAERELFFLEIVKQEREKEAVLLEKNGNLLEAVDQQSKDLDEFLQIH